MRQVRSVADRLHSAVIHLLRRLRHQDQASGLTASRLSALSVLVFGGPLPLGDLARAEQVRPPTMSRLVQGLIRDGLARRTSDRRDRRVARIQATPKGARILQQGRRRRVRALAVLLRSLPPKELEAMSAATGILERLLHPQSRWPAD